MKTEIKKTHILGIDIVRFAAAVIVVLFHFGFLMGAMPEGISGVAARGVGFPELYKTSYFGWVGVEIFFVISGFVIAFSSEKATAYSFFVSRVVRLAPGAWICSSITLVVMFLLSVPHTTPILPGFIHSMMLLPVGPYIDGSIWTLPIEIAFYLSVFIIVAINRFDLLRPLAITIGLVSAVFCSLLLAVAAGFVLDPAVPLYLKKFDRIFSLLLLIHGSQFALGVFTWFFFFKEKTKANLCWICLFWLVGTIEVLRQALPYASTKPEGAAWIVPAVWTAGVVGIFLSIMQNESMHRLPNPIQRLIKFLGKMTFPLYLVHQIVGVSIAGYIYAQGYSRWTAIFIAIILVLIITIAVTKYLEPKLQTFIRAGLSNLRARRQLKY